MANFQLFAQPWWVNLLIFVPFCAYYFLRKQLALTKSQLLFLGIFGLAFGFVEAAVVVYLRLALGFSANILPPLSQLGQSLAGLPRTLLTIEFFRNLATLVMLVSVALAAARELRQRCAVFLWTFAFWDIFYYAGLWLTVRWPGSLTAPDVLFLVPVPWYAQVWFPLLVSGLTVGAVLLAVRAGRQPPA